MAGLVLIWIDRAPSLAESAVDHGKMVSGIQGVAPDWCNSMNWISRFLLSSYSYDATKRLLTSLSHRPDERKLR
jgi:hypothetical protein